MLLPLVMVTVAPASASGVAQLATGQASTVPLMLKPVTVRVTFTVWEVLTAALELSVAVIVMMPG
jgi:hypothetical protein